jgi:hypothetical protein
MTDMEPAENLPDDPGQVSAERIRNLCDSINALVDEKHALMAANDRLANELKACIAEKGELQKHARLFEVTWGLPAPKDQERISVSARDYTDALVQLKRLSGMGLQENRPGFFQELAERRKKD